MRICKTLREDLQGFARLWEGSQDGGRGLMRILETLGEDLQGFARL